MRLPLLIAASLLAATSLWGGQTYRQWLAQAPQPSPLEFRPWTGSEKIAALAWMGDAGPELPRAPHHRLLGHLHLERVPAESFPVTVEFIYGREDARPPGASRAARRPLPQGFMWGEPLGLIADTEPLSAVWSVRSVRIEPAQRQQPLPVWALWAEQRPRQRREHPDAYSLRIEARSHGGQLLARLWLIEACVPFGAGRQPHPLTGMTMEDPEADRFLGALGVSELHRETRLPAEWAAYDRVGAVWVGRSALQDARLTPEFYRRLLLSGTILAARPAECEQLAARIGLRVGDAVLSAALLRGDELFDAPSPVASGAYPQRFGGWNGQRFAEPESLTQNPVRALRRYCAWYLGSFVVLQALLLGGGFMLWRGRRRVMLWLVMPAFALLYSAGGWVLAQFQPDLRPSAWATEYVYSYRNWPEAFAQTAVDALTFASAPVLIQMPAASEPGTRVERVLHWWRELDRLRVPQRIELDSTKTLVHLRALRGAVVVAAAARWLTNHPPCSIGADDALHFAEPFELAWVWDGQSWRNLGRVAAGETRSLAKQPQLFSPAQFEPLLKLGAGPHRFSYFAGLGDVPGRVAILTDLRWTRQRGMAGSGILLGLQDAGVSVEVLGVAGPELRSRRVRVHQFALQPVAEAQP